VAACPHEARSFFSWLAGTSAAALPGNLQIMFGIGGEHDLTERELPHLAGWRNSQPVRIGNAAWSQLQLDVLGELLSAARTLTDQLAGLEAPERQLLVGAADAAAARWQEPDEGIWEVRGDRRHFLYSKLMCWLALDSAVDLAPLLTAKDRVSAWAASRDEIHDTILARGWRNDVGAFTQALDSDELDASALMIPIVGLLPPDDPRVLSTIRVIETRLSDEHGLVYRYRAPDGLPGDEGAFLACTFWLAHAQALGGLHDHARATFERAASNANDLGLLSEEIDPSTGELLGNFPQAFTHIALVNAAWAIAQAE
jgi:alpha,alpha-trehalase